MGGGGERRLYMASTSTVLHDRTGRESAKSAEGSRGSGSRGPSMSDDDCSSKYMHRLDQAHLSA
jgi:hypothetical protein